MVRWLITIGVLAQGGALGVIDPADIGPSICARELRLRGLPAQSPSLTVWNYFGRTFDTAGLVDFRNFGEGFSSVNRGEASILGQFKSTPSAVAQALRRGSPFLQANPAHTEVGSGSRGRTLLDRNQFFPLQVMEDTNYISARLRQAQALVPRQLNPNQVLFIEATTERTGGELIDQFGRVPDFARREPIAAGVANYFAQFDLGHERTPEEEAKAATYQLKEGATWILSGQPGGQRLRLHLESDDLVLPIDRQKYPYVWELGRAAQISSQAFFETLRMGLYFASRELILLGGNLDEAYLFGHSLNERIGNVYRRTYLMHDFSGYQNSPGQLAHVRPLKDALQSIDIKNVNPAVGSLVGASGNQLSAFEALQLWLSAQQNRTEFLSDADEKNVIELRDFSFLSRHLLILAAQKYSSLQNEEGQSALNFLGDGPMAEYRDSLADYAVKDSEQYGFAAQGRVVRKRNIHNRLEYDGLQNLDEFLSEFKAIEVSSDAELTGEELLVVSYRRAIEKLAAQGDPNPKKTLVDLKVNFVLLNQSAMRIPSTGSWHVYRSAIKTYMGLGLFNFTPQTVSREISLTAAAYSADAVATLSEALGPTIAAYNRGQEHLRRYLGNPDLFAF